MWGRGVEGVVGRKKRQDPDGFQERCFALINCALVRQVESGTVGINVGF